MPDVRVPLRADEEDLRQILDNLLDRAIKYTPRAGRLELLLGLGADGQDARLEVVDSGVGIERFYRVDKARSRELGGTALGLAIVKHLALSLDGTVDVKSAPAQRTRCSVLLPTAELEACCPPCISSSCCSQFCPTYK